MPWTGEAATSDNWDEAISLFVTMDDKTWNDLTVAWQDLDMVWDSVTWSADSSGNVSWNGDSPSLDNWGANNAATNTWS